MADAGYIGENTDLILGQEFLTWLWYRSETANGQFRMSASSSRPGEAYALSMEQRVVVRGGEGDHMETASVSGSLSPLREARLGLTTGKFVVRALIRLEKDSMDWRMTLKAEDFSLSSLRTPAVAKEDRESDDPDALFLEKMYLIESGLSMLDDMFRQFLDVRLDTNKWTAEAAEVSAWMVRDLSQGAI